MENQLTEVQIKAIKNAITDSMRKSLSGSNLIYDPNFERSIEAVADLVIKNAQIKLSNSKKEKVIKNLKVIKNARK